MNLEHLDFFRNQISFYRDSSRVYFDSTSFTLVNDRVLDSVDNFYKSGGTRPTTGLYPGTALATTTIESCRELLKELFSVQKGEIVFPLSRGIGLNQILYSLSLIQPTAIFAYTGLDHDCWLPVFEFAKQKNISFYPVSVQNTEIELLSNLNLLFEKPAEQQFVLILPLHSLGNGLFLSKDFFQKITSNHNVITIVDCSFAAGVSEINLSDLTIDFAVFDSNIGLGGPIGSSIMYINDSHVELMRPFTFLGNGSISKVTESSYGFEDMPQRLESGINPSVMAGLQVALTILKEISLATISEHINTLKNLFLEQSKTINGLILTGSYSQDQFTNIIGLLIPEVNMHEIAMYLDEVCQIDVRTGSFCAHQLIDQLYANLNLDHSNLGILQVSFHYYNTEAEIEKLFDGIREFLNIFK